MYMGGLNAKSVPSIQGGQKRFEICWDCNESPCGYWELNPGPLEE